MSPVHDPATIAVATATTHAGNHIGFGAVAVQRFAVVGT
jgi:hypothetical protein